MSRTAAQYLSLLAGLILAGCSHQTDAPRTLALNRAEAAMVDAINGYRAERNLPELVADARLCAAADEHNHIMRDRIRVLGLDAGTTHWGRLGHRLRDAGYDYSFAAENVAAGRGVAAPELLQGLLDSPSHHANIVSSRARSIGIAVWREGDAVYVTQEFAAP